MSLPEYKKHWLYFKGRIVNFQHGRKKYVNVKVIDIDINRRTIFFQEEYGRGRKGMVSGGIVSMVEVETQSLVDVEDNPVTDLPQTHTDLSLLAEDNGKN